MYFRSVHFRETVIRCPALRGCRGKSGHHRAGFPTKAGGACFKTGSRPVPQKINRLTREVRVKRWGKSPPPNEQSNGHGKPNPMQDEIGNRAARPMVSGTSHPFYEGIISIAEILDEWMTSLWEYRIRLIVSRDSIFQLSKRQKYKRIIRTAGTWFSIDESVPCSFNIIPSWQTHNQLLRISAKTVRIICVTAPRPAVSKLWRKNFSPKLRKRTRKKLPLLPSPWSLHWTKPARVNWFIQTRWPGRKPAVRHLLPALPPDFRSFLFLTF